MAMNPVMLTYDASIKSICCKISSWPQNPPKNLMFARLHWVQEIRRPTSHLNFAERWDFQTLHFLRWRYAKCTWNEWGKVFLYYNKTLKNKTLPVWKATTWRLHVLRCHCFRQAPTWPWGDLCPDLASRLTFSWRLVICKTGGSGKIFFSLFLKKNSKITVWMWIN